LDYFKSFKASDGTSYSLDMVRLRCDYGNKAQELCDFLGHLASYDLRYDITYAYSFNRFKYRHLWTVKDTLDGSSWTVGLGIGDTPTVGFIEFNPNKCERSPLFKCFWEDFRMKTYKRELVRYDLAIDIPRPRSEVFLVRQGKKTYSMYQTDDGVTEYQGKRNTSGFIKVYDKTIESKLTEDLTRVELTLDRDEDIARVFPSVRMRESQYSLMEDDALGKRDALIVKLLLQTEVPQAYLRDLDYRQRKRIESHLGSRTLSLDIHSFVSVRELALSYE